MNITRVQLSNFRSWPDVELDVAAGVTLLSGPNGAGKSSLIDAMLFAMYGASSGAEALIRRGTDVAVVVVEISNDAGDLQITRTIRRTGNRAAVSLDVRQHVDGSLMPLSGATVTETQLILDGLLGVSREVLQASAFSTQHGGGAFTEAAPRDRKRVFSEILALGFWEQLADEAKAEKRAADDAANVARAELERLDGAAERWRNADFARQDCVQDVFIAGAAVEEAERDATRLAAEAEAAREARRQHAAAVEAEKRARADHERAGVERAAADEALARAKAAAANAPSVEDAEVLAHEADCALADEEAALAGRVKTTEAYRTERASIEDQLDDLIRAQRGAEITDLMLRIREAKSGTCPECKQALHDDSLVRRLTEQQGAAIEANSALVAQQEPLWGRLAVLAENPPAEPDDTAVLAARARVSAARTRLAEAQTIQSLAGSIDAAHQRSRDAMDRQAETGEALRVAIAALEAAGAVAFKGHADDDHQAALSALALARSAHSAAAAELARAEEAAKLAERQAAEETAARERLEVATREAAVAGVLAAGFGPTGVPALIVDSVLGQLTETWNRVLARVGARQRIDLRSQKLLKTSDRLADTLDIIVLDGSFDDVPYESLSGGERTRVSIAGRVALTELLASKKGARVSIMVLDEPAGLDSEGSEQLAAVLQEFVASGVLTSILLVTHADALADLIGNVVRIEKGSDGCSRLVGAAATRDEVAA